MLTNEQITTLSEKYIDTVFRVALNYTKNPVDAQDITQNIFFVASALSSGFSRGKVP